MWISCNEFKSLEGRIKYLEERIRFLEIRNTEPKVPLDDIGDRCASVIVMSSDGCSSAYGHGGYSSEHCYVGVTEVVRGILNHLGLRLSRKPQVPAKVELTKAKK